MKKGLKITIIILLSILIILLTIFATKIHSIKTIYGEIVELSQLDIRNEEVDKTLKTKGKISKVEKAVLNYYEDYYDYKKIYATYRVEELTNTLTNQYLSENKNNLKNLKEEFKNKTREVDTAITNIKQMLKEETIMSYAEQQKLNPIYTELYRIYMISDDDNKYISEWDKINETNTKKLEYLNELLDLLVNNKNYWYIKNDTLYFDKDEVLIKYNDLHDLIYDIEEKQEGVF